MITWCVYTAETKNVNTRLSSIFYFIGNYKNFNDIPDGKSSTYKWQLIILGKFIKG
jgi:hypothetical protein